MLWVFWILGLWALYKLVDKLSRIPRYKGPKGRVKYILITGCDTGFGNLLAKRLDGRGFYVFAACLKVRNSHPLRLITSKLVKLGY
jgi:hypothetical protein